MRVRTMASNAPRLIWVLLGFAVINWLIYFPFIELGWVGIYPFATLYSRLLSVPAALLTNLLLMSWLWVTLACALCLLLLCFTRKRRYRRILIGIMTIPLVILALFPLAGTYVPWQSLTIEPWAKTYHVAYRAFASDDTYGTGMLFECERWGILCRNVKSFADFYGGSSRLKLQYDADRFTLMRQGDSAVLYQRSGGKVL
jgi:hypothetical protein